MRYFLLIFLTLTAVVVGIAGFRRHMSRKPPIVIIPDLDQQFKLRPEAPDNFFTNGITSQLPPQGTVARGRPIHSDRGSVYAYENSPVNTGFVTGTTNFIATNPLPVTPKLLKHGRVCFNVFCMPCHGPLANGNGITKMLGDMPAVANLHNKRIVDMPDGEIFNVITHGKGLMAAYGPTVGIKDRWAIIAYLRALQLSWLGTTNDLPPAMQTALAK